MKEPGQVEGRELLNEMRNVSVYKISGQILIMLLNASSKLENENLNNLHVK